MSAKHGIGSQPFREPFERLRHLTFERSTESVGPLAQSFQT